MAVENERNPRSKALEDALRDAGSEINIDSLLDVLQAVVTDCDGPALRRVKNIESFLDRYQDKSREITKWRTNDKDFDVLKTIGKGAFGMVQLVRHLPTRKVYAMKMLNKHEMVKRSEPTCFWEERYILVNANSDWIVKLYYAFQDVKYLYMVMDYMAGGDLATLMDGYDFTVQWVRFYCAEMILAVDIIHKMGFVHRDVKPDNMLLDCSGHLKLADFGTCTRMGADGLVRCDVPVGTPDYISPEVLRAQEQGKGFGKYGRECDYWSVGICLYEMLCGVTPFYHESLSFTYANIMNHQKSLAFPDPEEVSLSEAAKNLICSFLCDWSVRLGKNGNEEIKAHPFFINDVWTFDNIRDTPAPVVPELRSDDDSSYFCTPDDDNKHEQGSFEPSSDFEANHLCFAGFTYTRDNPLLQSDETRQENSMGSVQSRVPSDSREKVGQLLNENQELARLISTARGELIEQQRKLDVEIELRSRAENKMMELITRLEEEQMAKVQLAQNSHHHNERLAFYERQLKDAKEKLVQETELVVKLKKKNSELTKNVTVFDTTVRDLKEKLSQLYNKCGAHERDMANLNLQLDQERQLTVKANERAQEIQTRYSELSEEMERLRRGYSDRSQEIKGLEEKLASKEKQEAMLELELKNAQGRYEAEATSLRREMASLTDENKQLMNSSEEATAVQAIRDKLQDEVDQKQKILQKLQESEKHISVLQVDQKQIQQQLTKQQADYTAQSERILQLTREVDEERHRRVHLQTEINQLEIEVSRLVRLEGQLQIEKRELEGAVSHFQQELSTLKATRDTLQMQVADLTENLETESSFRVIYKKECEDLQEELEAKTKAFQDLEDEKVREEEKFKKQIETLEREKTRTNEERSALEKDKLDLEIEKCKMQAEKESLLRQLNEGKEKLEKAQSECSELQDKVNEASSQGVNINNNNKNINNNVDKEYESQIEILNQKLAKEKVLTQQAVNKLAEVMNRKSAVTAASAPTKGGVNKTAEYRKKEKQCRQLEQDLTTLKLRHHTLNGELDKVKYALDVSRAQEEKTRKSMQELLDQKEMEIEALKAQLEVKSGLQNPGSLSSLTDILDEDLSDARKDGWLSVPIRQNIKRYGWKRQWVVATSQKVMFFNQEHDFGNTEPTLSLEISRLFHVRSVTQGDVIRANSDDIPKIFQVLYADEREQRKEAELALSVTEYKNHQMVPITFYMPTSCDICQKQLWSMMRHLPALECRLCRVKIHKEHVEKDKDDNSLAACKVKWLPSKDPARDLLCLAENDRIQGDWVKFLSVLIQKGGYTAQERARVRSLGRSATKGRA